MDVHEPSSDRPSFTAQSGDRESFYDAPDDRGKRSAFHRNIATAPSVESSRGKGKQTEASCDSAAEVDVRQGTVKRGPYFPREHSPRSDRSRYSVAVQTSPEEGQRRMDTDSESEAARQYLECHSDDEEDVYVDALETLSAYDDDVATGVERDSSRNSQDVTTGGCKGRTVRASPCPGGQSLHRSGFGTTPGDGCQESCTVHPSQPGRPTPRDAPCCSCLLTVLYWLVLMLFLSFLLSLFFAIFLLFSRNHGLGIGPALLYSDVDVIRNHINPHLDLRHNGAPPT